MTETTVEKMTLESSHNQILVWFLKTFPELTKDMKECTHFYDAEHINPYHVEDDIMCHSLMVFKNSQIFSPDNNYCKWSAILHDIGKPLSKQCHEDKQKCNFIGHEGISAFMVADILNKTDISTEDKIHIFKIVALHGSLFHFIKADGTIKADLKDTFEGNSTLLSDVVLQVRNDSFGRFVDEGKVTDHDPLFTQMLPDHFEDVVHSLGDGVYRGDKPHQLTILVGPPCSRKSAWLENNTNGAVVISRDDLVEEVGARHGMENYSDSWKWLKMNEKVEKKEVDQELISRVQTARREKQDVIIDMTNMSKKSRRKWINQFEKDYNKRAVVFITGYEAQLECNIKRERATGKRINKFVTLNMIKGFSLPMYGEGFDTIDFIWND